MDYHQPHGYMWLPPPPPPPPGADPFQRPPLPPPPSNHPWPYPPTQFHYQPQPQSQHSPSHPPLQWPPPPHSSDLAKYPPHPPPPPYTAHQPPSYTAHPHYPLPPPLPPRPSHLPQPYTQDWGSGSWNHHQSWKYPTAADNNEEDWAARAKAWAAAKSASDNKHMSSQFVMAGRPEEQNHFHDQYPQPMDPQYTDGHTPLAPASNYPQFPVAVGASNRTSVGQLQDSQYKSSGHSSYAPEAHALFAARDGGAAGDSIPQYLPLEKSSITPLVHPQEVPSSHSSISGNLEAGDRNEKLNSSSSLPVSSHSPHHIQHMLPTNDRSGWAEDPHHILGSHPAESIIDMSDQPLNFAPHFKRDPETHVQPNYAHLSGISGRVGDPTVAMSSNYVWPPSTTAGAAYPPAPPSMPLGPQVDHPVAAPSPVSGHTAPIFPPGPTFQPALPMLGAAFGVGAGITPQTTTFLGDAYGSAERPKKASVPNWLREEIIKNKTVITSSSSPPISLKLDSQSVEDDNNDKSSRKGDQSDGKSIDSSGSTEDEDEDEVEAARSASINQEIKRILTEVLLKVTDELFDEIATRVLEEDDPSVEVGRDIDLPNQHLWPPTPSVSTPKASAKVLIPMKTKGTGDDANEKSTSDSPRDILGLASYGSDAEDEIQSSGNPNSKESSMHQHSSSNKLLGGDSFIENDVSHEETEEQRNVPAKLDASSSGKKGPGGVANMKLNDHIATKDSKRMSGVVENEFRRGYDTSNLTSSLNEKSVERNEVPDGKFEAKRWQDNDCQIQNSRIESDKNDGLENKKSLIKKENRDRNDYHNTSKDKAKEKVKTDEKAKNTESRKRLSPDDKDGPTGTHKDRRTSSKKDDDERRKERTGDERKERSRHKSGAESSRRKRRRSSSVGAKDRENKDNLVVSRVNDSSNESSDDSKRKSHHSRKLISPLPTRTRKRQVSRSPSKHSKRRHSPYSSLESTRGKRSP